MTLADETNPIPPIAEEAEIPPSIIGRLLALRSHRATFVLVDQGIVSLGNFFMLGALTTMLGQEKMGAYSVLFDTILYLNGIQNALVIYPLLVRGAIGGRENLGRLATASILFTLMLLPLLGGATLGAAGVLKNLSIALPAVLSLVFWQIQETTRRALMADLRFVDAIWGDAISYLGQAGIILVLARNQQLNLYGAFLVMALTSAAAAVLQAWQIGLKPLRFWELRLVARDFWKLGRWSLLANASGLITNLGYTWTLAASAGLAGNALFSAVVYPFRLANPVMSSMGGLITPSVARASTTSMRAASRSALRYIGFGAALLFPYFILLLIFAPQILTYLSHGDKPYYQYPHLLRLFVANYSACYLLAVISAWLGGLGHSRYNFYVSLVNILVTLVIGLPLTWFYGVGGLIIGGLFAAGISALTAIYFIYHLAHRPLAHPTAHSPGSL